MLMTKGDFDVEQIYHSRKRKLLNQTLHGWGVVCGLKVKPTTPAGQNIVIETGLALDCAGNEIFVSEPYVLDVIEIIKSCVTLKKKPTTADDCVAIDERQTRENKWYVVIRYQEVPADPVPVNAPGGGCEEKVCEYSRTREGYCIELCQEKDLNVPCPERLREGNGKCEEWENVIQDPIDKEKENVREFLCEDLLLECPSNCCDNLQVVLGSITFVGHITSKTIVEKDMINNWDCRKYVITFGLLQHWMDLFAPTKIPFDAIVNYTSLGNACINVDEAVKAFEGICKEEAPEPTPTPTLTPMPTSTPTTFNPNDFPGRQVDEVRGIGPEYKERLEAKGIKNLAELASIVPARLAEILEISEVRAVSFIDEARCLLRG
jgi:predicted flap endonuclease-1-like 5' DNA nuclease